MKKTLSILVAGTVLAHNCVRMRRRRPCRQEYVVEKLLFVSSLGANVHLTFLSSTCSMFN